VTVAFTGLPGHTGTDDVLGPLVRAVSVVSARHGPSVHAMTVDSLAAVSHDPPRVVVAVRRQCRWWQLASAAGGFGASVLSADQQDEAKWFASRRRGLDGDQLEPVGWWPGVTTGAPLLDRAAAWFECRLEVATRVGHQVVVVGAVTGDLGRDPERSALLRVDRAYRSLPR
jgi:flavin reductase (DIM6/NTAB) family NADH-FMN oxidoreductase RutF